MNIKDLMIGDFVFHEKYGNAKVEMITNDFKGDPEVMLISENIKHKDGYQYGYCYCEPDEIYPLPLTEEILEKNGFDEIGDDTYQLKENRTWFWVDFHNKEYGCTYDESNYYLEDYSEGLILNGIPDVHQLQHALKLCGIEKEIEI